MPGAWASDYFKGHWVSPEFFLQSDQRKLFVWVLVCFLKVNVNRLAHTM